MTAAWAAQKRRKEAHWRGEDPRKVRPNAEEEEEEEDRKKEEEERKNEESRV
jgi:hypothetical protein